MAGDVVGAMSGTFVAAESWTALKAAINVADWLEDREQDLLAKLALTNPTNSKLTCNGLVSSSMQKDGLGLKARPLFCIELVTSPL